ncbi:hypothetical protein MPER_07422, partial [Moniliophthora perniciosa FA553]
MPTRLQNTLAPTTSSQAASLDPMTGEVIALPDIQPNRMVFTKNPNPTPPPSSKTLVFGRTFTDHMLTVPWDAVNGWGAPHIQP